VYVRAVVRALDLRLRRSVAGLTPGLALLRDNSKEVVHTHVSLSPRGIIWYR